MSKTFWRNLVQASLHTQEDEITCTECMEMLDQYVDLLDAGEKPSTVLPELEQHLQVCNCCHDQLEGLLVAIRAAVQSNN